MANRFALTWLRLSVVNGLRLRFRATSATLKETIQLWRKSGECKPAGLSLKRSRPVSSSPNSVAPYEDSRVPEFIFWKKVKSKSTFQNCAAEGKTNLRHGRAVSSVRSISQSQQMKIPS